jgi:hypothetical protein
MSKRSARTSYFQSNTHSEASAEEAEAAESGADAAESISDSGGLRAGATVCVKVIATDKADRGRDDLGSARVLREIEVGQRARISLESGSLLVTSEVRALVQVKPGGYWVTTANTTYLVEVRGSSD